MQKIKLKLTKKQALSYAKNIFLILAGCALLAFGDAAFLTPFNIVSGGIVSIGIIVSHYVPSTFVVNDIVVAACQVVLFLVGLLVLGKKFSIHTLLATIAYPLMYALMLRLNAGKPFVDALNSIKGSDGLVSATSLLLAAIFGGSLVGAGCALTFLGDGSTGGLDILAFIIAKYTNVKQGVSSFCIDALIIIVGIFCLENYVGGLIGIIGAFMAAGMIQIIYVIANSYYIVDIISCEYEAIKEYIHVEMDHATTLIDTIGGYTGEGRQLIRVCIYKDEMNELRDFIAKKDPRAFVSFTKAQAINGEGFEPFSVSSKKKLIKKYKKNVELNSQNVDGGAPTIINLEEQETTNIESK